MEYVKRVGISMILVGNGRVITNDENDRIIENGCIVIDGNTIKEIGETSLIKCKYEDKEHEYIDANGKVIMPGMINTHHHIYSQFARGLNFKSEKLQSFTDMLKNIWWKLDKKLTLEDLKYSAYTALIECIKDGVTTVFDHNSSPMSISGSLHTISNVADELGIRGCYCYEASDREGDRVLDLAIKENIDFIKYSEKKQDGMTKGMFGMHASFTLRDRSLNKCIEAMEGIDAGYHIHVAEGKEDLENSLKLYKKRVVKRLNDFGILGEKTIAAHCLYINDDELDILKDTKTIVVNNPESNMANGVGVSDIKSILDKGIVLGIGTDGYTSDIFESMKVENLINKYYFSDYNIGLIETKQMALKNNMKIASRFFEKTIGILKKGAYADIIIVDYKLFTPIDKNNYFGHILFGVSGKSVETTIINGKVVMKDRKIVSIDEEKICRESINIAEKLWKRV